jgi:hypothetical protein
MLNTIARIFEWNFDMFDEDFMSQDLDFLLFFSNRDADRAGRAGKKKLPIFLAEIQ